MGDVVDLLGRRVYGMSQVDHLLGLKDGTAQRWIDGYVRAGREYPPIVRPERTGEDIVTWGEFVEARLLANYRQANVPIARMRPVVEMLRDQLATAYPLAHAKLYARNRELVRVAQDDAKLEDALRIVVVRNGQTMLAEAAQDFMRAVDFDPKAGVVRTVQPDPGVPEVVLDPVRRFGEPTIDGVRTDILAELVATGDSEEFVAEMYHLRPEQVRDAVAFERRRVS